MVVRVAVCRRRLGLQKIEHGFVKQRLDAIEKLRLKERQAAAVEHVEARARIAELGREHRGQLSLEALRVQLEVEQVERILDDIANIVAASGARQSESIVAEVLAVWQCQLRNQLVGELRYTPPVNDARAAVAEEFFDRALVAGVGQFGVVADHLGEAKVAGRKQIVVAIDGAPIVL